MLPSVLVWTMCDFHFVKMIEACSVTMVFLGRISFCLDSLLFGASVTLVRCFSLLLLLFAATTALF